MSNSRSLSTRHFLDDRVWYHLTQVLSLSRESLAINDEKSFVSLGGHSLSAYSLLRRCRKDGILLSVRAILQSPSIRELVLDAKQQDFQNPSNSTGITGIVVTDAPNKASLQSPPYSELPIVSQPISYTMHKPSLCRLPSDELDVDSGQRRELTEMQTIMLWRSIVQPETNVVSVFDTYNTEDLPTVRSAWQSLIAVESWFQSCLTMVEGKGYLVYRSNFWPAWTERRFNDKEQYTNALAHRPAEVLLSTSFEVLTLDDGTSSSSSTVVWRTPHALLDGYSAQLLYGKLRTLINYGTIRPSAPLGEARVPQTLQMSAQNHEFWNQQQALFPEVSSKLPFLDRSNPLAGSRTSIESTSFEVPAARLECLSRETGVSIAAIYYAAWAITLSVFVNAKCVQFGAVLSGRNIDDAENIIGNLVNVLPLTISVDAGMTIERYLRDVSEALITLETASSSVTNDGFTRDFDSLLAMQFQIAPVSSDTNAVPLGLPRMELVSDVPLSVCVWPSGSVRVDWHSTRITKTNAINMSRCFANVLGLLPSPQSKIGDVLREFVPPDLMNEILTMSNAFSDATHPGSISDDLVMRFERTARDYPWCIAVQKGQETLTYCELDQKASCVAYHISTAVKPGDVVCVIADRSINWIVAIYGILKAGATYSPMDPMLPDKLQTANLAISNARALLIAGPTQSRIVSGLQCKTFLIHELINTPLSGNDGIAHRKVPRPMDDAYICFTSGSSGKPKGVRCSHEGLMAFHASAQTRMYSMPGSRTAQIMSPAFDGSIHEIFSALGWGSTLVLAHGDDQFDHLQSVHCAVMTPSIAKTLDPDDFPLLKTISMVGEPLPQRVSDQWSATRLVLNMYGPTEGTCGATTAVMHPRRAVTIGRPNITTRLYILDQRGNLCPPSVVGEIFLAGIQVACGYVGRPEETASRFRIDPFIDRGKQMMYRTGDRAFWNADGVVEYVGREDRLIKLRGIRLDLGDVETRIRDGVPGVTAVAIAMKEDSLVALVQPACLDVSDLRARMRNVVPQYAVPQHIICVGEFPRTSVGKVDYKAVAAMTSRISPAEVQGASPLSSSEQIISGIWRNILNLDSDQVIYSTSDFRLLGGHSLLQLTQIDRLRSAFRVHIPFSLVIENQRLSDVAAAIDKLLQLPSDLNSTRLKSGRGRPLGRNQMSPLDKEWWHKYQLHPSSSTSFTVAYAVALDPAQINLERLCAAWSVVLGRHEILRSRHIKAADGQLSRIYDPSHREAIQVEDIDIRQEINRSFDIELDSPIRVVISKSTMVATLSHIICDYTALHTLLRELTAAYRGTPLPAIPATFSDSLAWSKPVAQSTQEFWRQTLSDLPSPTFPVRNSYHGTSRMYQFPASLYHGLRALCKRLGTSLHQIAVAAVSLVLTFEQQHTDVMIGAPFLNRDSNDSTVVGNFVQALPVRVKYRGEEAGDLACRGSDNFLEAVQKSCQSSLAHAIPTNQILEYHPQGRDTISSIPEDPLLEVMVTLHDESTTRKLTALDLSGTQPLSVWAEGSKFKLMLEFCAIGDDHFTVRAEWDKSVAGSEECLRCRITLLEEAFGGLEKGLRYEQIKGQIAMVRQEVESGMRRSADPLHAFGRPMA